MFKQIMPKVLIVSRLTWDDSSNSNTLTNLFSGYPSDLIARIYIETKKPRTNCCHRFYQISEIALLKKLWRWNIKTGHAFDTENESYCEQKKDEATEQSMMSFVRSHRHKLFTYMRDILWSFGGWKTKELTSFIRDFNPDIIWLDGSPLILMNRLNNYVKKVAGKPSVTFLMDDVYTYRSCPSLMDKLYKSLLRKHVMRTVKEADHVFVASPKMKKEYDAIFGVNSTFIAKGVDYSRVSISSSTVGTPIKMVYFGNVLIGRLQSLILIAEAIADANKKGKHVQLDIYTGDNITVSDRKALLSCDNVRLMKPVPYNEVAGIMNESDVVVFVEALTGKKKNIARLSFSTKIVDYIGSGKCIFAVGPDDAAPIEYLRDNRIALVATNKQQVYDNLMVLNKETIEDYQARVNNFGHTHHDIHHTQQIIYDQLLELYHQRTLQ